MFGLNELEERLSPYTVTCPEQNPTFMLTMPGSSDVLGLHSDARAQWRSSCRAVDGAARMHVQR